MNEPVLQSSSPAISLMPRDLVNRGLAELLREVRSSPSNQDACGRLDEVLQSLGSHFPQDRYSLTIHMDYRSLDDKSRRILDSWNVETEQSRIPVAPPMRETTGTHGSGERQKLAEAVLTAATDDQGNRLFLVVNLWGRYNGMYHKLECALTVALPIDVVSALEVTEGPQWSAQLSQSAQNVRNSQGSRWPSFVDAQISALKSFAQT